MQTTFSILLVQMHFICYVTGRAKSMPISNMPYRRNSQKSRFSCLSIFRTKKCKCWKAHMRIKVKTLDKQKVPEVKNWNYPNFSTWIPVFLLIRTKSTTSWGLRAEGQKVSKNYPKRHRICTKLLETVEWVWDINLQQ